MSKNTFLGSVTVGNSFTKYQAHDHCSGPLAALIPEIPLSLVPKLGIRVPSGLGSASGVPHSVNRKSQIVYGGEAGPALGGTPSHIHPQSVVVLVALRIWCAYVCARARVRSCTSSRHDRCCTQPPIPSVPIPQATRQCAPLG